MERSSIHTLFLICAASFTCINAGFFDWVKGLFTGPKEEQNSEQQLDIQTEPAQYEDMTQPMPVEYLGTSQDMPQQQELILM